MTTYRNLSGTSGVSAYDIGDDFIIVSFKRGGTYLYNYTIPGEDSVERMKALAIRGKGLNTYISKYVRKRCAGKM